MMERADMSLFADTLNWFHQRSKQSTKLLAELIGEDPSYLTKVKQGKFLPSDPDFLPRLSAALCLSPEEMRRLTETFRISQIGEARYRLLCASRDVLTAAGPEPVHAVLRKLGAPPENGTVEGRENVERLLYLVLAEGQRGEGPICILAQPDEEILRHAIATAVEPDARTEIRLISRLSQGEYQAAGTDNLRILAAQMPLLLQTEQYRPYHYYQALPESGRDDALLPNLVVTEQCAVELSRDFSHALVHRIPQYVSVYRRLFEARLAACQPTVLRRRPNPDADPFRPMQELLEQGVRTRRIGLESTFFSLPGLTREMVEQAVAAYPPRRADFLLESFTAMEQTLRRIRSEKRQTKTVVSVFSAEVLRNFAEDGRCRDLDERDLFGETPPAWRAEILSNLLELAYEGIWLPAVLRPEAGGFSPLLSCVSTENGSCELRFRAGGGGPILEIRELGISEALREFMEYLPESDLVYSHAETIRLLQQTRDGIRRRCETPARCKSIV